MRLLGLATFASLAACSSGTGPARDGPVTVVTQLTALVIGNSGSEPIYTFALARDASVVVDWIPCTDPSRCVGIARGAERVVPYSTIYGYSRATREINVYWWHLVPSGNAFVVDEVRVVVVGIPPSVFRSSHQN
jgi:hypothetical protein